MTADLPALFGPPTGANCALFFPPDLSFVGGALTGQTFSIAVESFRCMHRRGKPSFTRRHEEAQRFPVFPVCPPVVALGLNVCTLVVQRVHCRAWRSVPVGASHTRRLVLSWKNYGLSHDAIDKKLYGKQSSLGVPRGLATTDAPYKKKIDFFCSFREARERCLSFFLCVLSSQHRRYVLLPSDRCYTLSFPYVCVIGEKESDLLVTLSRRPFSSSRDSSPVPSVSLSRSTEVPPRMKRIHTEDWSIKTPPAQEHRNED